MDALIKAARIGDLIWGAFAGLLVGGVIGAIAGFMVADHPARDPQTGIERREDMDKAGEVMVRGVVIGSAVGATLFAGIAWWRQCRRASIAAHPATR